MGFNWLGRQIAEREQNIFRFLFFVAGKFLKRGAKTFYPKIILAVRAFDAVEEGGEFDELVPRVEKIEVKDLLPGHKLLAEYKTNSPGGNRK